MKKEEIDKIVIDTINAELKEYKRSINADKEGKWKEAEFRADLGLDSLKTVEIFMECENSFDVSFTDDEILKTKTVGELINKINDKLNYEKER